MSAPGERADAIPEAATEAGYEYVRRERAGGVHRPLVLGDVDAILGLAIPFLRAAQPEAGNEEAGRRISEATRYLRAVLTGHEHDLRRGELADVEAALAALDPASRAMEVPVRAAHPEADRAPGVPQRCRRCGREYPASMTVGIGLCGDCVTPEADRAPEAPPWPGPRQWITCPECGSTDEASDTPCTNLNCPSHDRRGNVAALRERAEMDGSDRAPGEVETVAREGVPDGTYGGARRVDAGTVKP